MKNQHSEILEILKTSKRGMNSYEWRTKYIQLPVRIMELKQMGYNIVSEKKKDRSVNYILLDASTGHTEPVIQPENPWEKDYEPYIGKDGRTYYREKQVSI